MVDLDQKNEVCQIAIAANEEELQKEQKKISQLDIELKEILDKRKI